MLGMGSGNFLCPENGILHPFFVYINPKHFNKHCHSYILFLRVNTEKLVSQNMDGAYVPMQNLHRPWIRNTLFQVLYGNSHSSARSANADAEVPDPCLGSDFLVLG